MPLPCVCEGQPTQSTAGVCGRTRCPWASQVCDLRPKRCARWINDLVRVRIQSRHKAAKTYWLWIEWNPKAITGWYCTCPTGARTVGCCGHVASVIWFLSIARHDQDQYLRKAYDWMQHLLDAQPEGAPDEDVPEEE